jgi:hypothetical protein
VRDGAGELIRFNNAIAAIDAANGDDPEQVSWEGATYPGEVLYSMRMSHWLARLDPNASEPLRLAVRCQHLCRWKIARSSYPMTRAGYHQWRTTLARFHADRAGEILASVAYDEQTIARVQSLIRKERLKTDPEAQALEDAACLVFLELDYVSFARGHEPQKVIDILKKTWKKMSPAGHALAFALAKGLPEGERGLIEEALGQNEK